MPQTLSSVTVYSAENRLRQPSQFATDAWADLLRARTLAFEMFKRDMQARYRQSRLGPVLVLTPAMVVTLWALVFRSANIIRIDSDLVPYPLFVAIGAVLWTTFVEAIEAPIAGIAAERAILSRSTAPAEAILLSRSAQVLTNFLVKSSVVVGLFAVYRIAPSPSLLLALPTAVALILLGTGLGLLLAPLNLLYRDVTRLLWVVLSVWFFLTPVFFPIPAEGALRLLIALNPAALLLSASRDWALGTVVAHPAPVFIIAVFTVPFALAGWAVLRACLPIVIEHGGD